MSIQVLTMSTGDNKQQQKFSPLLQSLVTRRQPNQLDLLTSAAAASGILSSVGQDDEIRNSSIVSHLRSVNNGSAMRQDIESLLRAKQQLSNSVAAAASMEQAALVRALSRSVLPTSHNHGFGFFPPQNSSHYALAAQNMELASLSRLLHAERQASMMMDSRLHRVSLGTSTNSCQSSGPTKRAPIVLFMECDEDSLSEYQCLIRQQIEIFQADKEEAASSVQGRNKQIVEGQVGIRCRHCASVPPRRRQKGCMYFPTKLDRIYQAAQNLSAFHLCQGCKHVPEDVRKKIVVLRERKSPAGGGKRYWAEGVRCLGVVETADGLRFSNKGV